MFFFRMLVRIRQESKYLWEFSKFKILAFCRNYSRILCVTIDGCTTFLLENKIASRMFVNSVSKREIWLSSSSRASISCWEMAVRLINDCRISKFLFIAVWVQRKSVKVLLNIDKPCSSQHASSLLARSSVSLIVERPNKNFPA